MQDPGELVRNNRNSFYKAWSVGSRLVGILGYKKNMSERSSRATGIQILKLDQVSDVTGLGKTTIYEYLKPTSRQYDPTFPCQIKVGARSVGWDEAEIQAWLESRRSSPRPNLGKRTDRNAQEKALVGEDDRRIPSQREALGDALESAEQGSDRNERQCRSIGSVPTGKSIDSESLEGKRIAVLRQMLERHAKRGALLSYQEVMEPTMLSTDVPEDRIVMDTMLETVSRASHAENRVLLGALVYSRRDAHGHPCPSDALIELARSLGYVVDNPFRFVEREVRRLLDFYNPTTEPHVRTMWIDLRGRLRLARWNR